VIRTVPHAVNFSGWALVPSVVPKGIEIEHDHLLSSVCLLCAYFPYMRHYDLCLLMFGIIVLLPMPECGTMYWAEMIN
jgi:hypothetical protein